MRQSGFTLIEVLLCVAIISLLVGLSLPVYESYARRNDLDLTTQSIAATFRRAATYARAVNNDSAWSVRVENTKVTLYQGNDFATRDQANDEVVLMPPSITPNWQGDVQFSKLHAIPTPSGPMILSSTTNDTRTITINAKGMVDY